MENIVDGDEAPEVKVPKRARRKGKLPGTRRNPTGYSNPRSPGIKAIQTGEPCQLCKQHHRTSTGKQACTGHARGTDRTVPCTNPPMDSGVVCRMHGGMTPAIRERAMERKLWTTTEGQVAALLRECDLPDQHPIDGLLEVVRHTGAMARLLGMMVGELDLKPKVEHEHNDTDNGIRVVKTGVYGWNHLGDQASHVLVALYGQWQDRYARACKLALDANIDERLVRNAEATTGALFEVVERALASAHLDPQQQSAFTKTLATEARKLVDPFGTHEKEAG